MAKQIKIDTGAIIKSIVVDSNSSSKTLEEIKNDRFPMPTKEMKSNNSLKVNNISPETIKGQVENTINSKNDALTKSEKKLWDELNKKLESEFYRDKKGTFLMSLSGDCLFEYEKIANGITYKTGKKVSRNEIIRKVLEDYIHNSKNKLKNIITKL